MGTMGRADAYDLVFTKVDEDIYKPIQETVVLAHVA